MWLFKFKLVEIKLNLTFKFLGTQSISKKEWLLKHGIGTKHQEELLELFEVQKLKPDSVVPPNCMVMWSCQPTPSITSSWEICAKNMYSLMDLELIFLENWKPTGGKWLDILRQVYIEKGVS